MITTWRNNGLENLPFAAEGLIEIMRKRLGSSIAAAGRQRASFASNRESPKNCCKRLAVPFLHFLEHIVKRLPDVKHILAGVDLYPLPKSLLLQTCEAEADLATRMSEDMNAEGAVDCKPKLIKEVVVTNTTASTLDA